MFHAPRPNENLAIGRLEYVEVRRSYPPTRKTLLYLAGFYPNPSVFFDTQTWFKIVSKWAKTSRKVC